MCRHCSTRVAWWGHWWLSHPEAPVGLSGAEGLRLDTEGVQCILCFIPAFLRHLESPWPPSFESTWWDCEDSCTGNDGIFR